MDRRFEPIQYKFDSNWIRGICPKRNQSKYREAFAKIADRYQDIADLKFEDFVETDPELAQAEYELDLHTAQVKCFDLHWIRDCADSLDLAYLSLVVAEDLYPEKRWEIVEGDEEIIVTDTERTMVFDIRNCHRLSGGGSLALVRDEVYQPSAAAALEAAEFNEKRYQMNVYAIEKMKEHLAAFTKAENVIKVADFRESTNGTSSRQES